MNWSRFFILSFVLMLVAMLMVGLYVQRYPYLAKKQYLTHVWTALNRVERNRDTMIRMRDGVHLAADVYLPKGFEPPYPTVYLQTLYGKHDYFGNLEALKLFAPHGYAIVAQDLRGRFVSGGEFQVYANVRQDAWDTLTWIAEQPWSDGNVGTFGCSALGETQYILATERHPNHKAMIVESGGGAIGSANERYGYFGLYEGGVFNLASGLGWFVSSGSKSRFHEQPGTITGDLLAQLPIASLAERSGSEPTFYEDYVGHQPGDPWWDSQGYVEEAEGFAMPGLHINQWFDLGVEDSLNLAFPSEPQFNAPQWAIVSPAAHCGSAELAAKANIGELPVVGGNKDYDALYVQFFDKWLKGEGSWDQPAVEAFVMGANRWEAFDTWPPPEAEFTSFYLSSATGANSAAGDGVLATAPVVEGQDRYLYDPANPVPTRGGVHCCTGNPADRPGSFDQQTSAARDDVLVYDSAILPSALTVAGPVGATLYVSTSAKDTDFTAKLVDVWPDGRAFNVQDGVFRLRYRNGFKNPEMAQEGQIYEIEISMRAVAYQFKKGHRLRLEVSSSNFPRLARNLNTGGKPELEEFPVVARNVVHHGPDHPSRLIVAVIPDD